MPKTNVKVELIGQDGNAFSILGIVRNALIKNNYRELATEFMEEATKGDYNHLLSTVMKYVDIM